MDNPKTRDQIAEAVLKHFGHDRAGRTNASERQARGIADAVMRVVGPEVERLRAELASAKLDHIVDHDDAAGELSKVDVEVERLTKVLAEMTALRDNAVRAAEHADQSIDVDLEGLVGDGLAALGWEWDNEISDLAPPKLVDAVVDLVRPVVAHAVKRAGQAEAERDALKAAAKKTREAAQRLQEAATPSVAAFWSNELLNAALALDHTTEGASDGR